MENHQEKTNRLEQVSVLVMIAIILQTSVFSDDCHNHTDVSVSDDCYNHTDVSVSDDCCNHTVTRKTQASLPSLEPDVIRSKLSGFDRKVCLFSVATQTN